MIVGESRKHSLCVITFVSTGRSLEAFSSDESTLGGDKPMEMATAVQFDIVYDSLDRGLPFCSFAGDYDIVLVVAVKWDFNEERFVAGGAEFSGHDDGRPIDSI